MEEQRQAMRAVAEQVTQRADVALGTMAQEGRALANALRGAADRVEQDGGRLMQGPLRSAAALVERWAETSTNGGPQQLFSSIEDFGRREPLALFGAAAVVGFLGTRALRAGAQARASSQMPRENTTMSFEQDAARTPPLGGTPLDTAPGRLGSAMNAQDGPEPEIQSESAEGALAPLQERY